MPRSYTHDYRSRCIYHITLSKNPQLPPFAHIGGTPDTPVVERTPLGLIVETNIRRISALDPALRLLQYVIMPDHIHLLLFVTARTDRALGSYMGMFKVRTGQDYRATGAEGGPVFEPDFYDCILYKDRSLDTVYQYIRDNPRRLLVRRCNPGYFHRTANLDLGTPGMEWEGYGNHQLLGNPFKEAVVVHRADSEVVRENNRRRWLHTATNGGVLVSPFISRDEKEIRREGEASGARIILLTNTPFPERYKPSAHDFSLCSEGRLLIIAPKVPLPPTRATFLHLNALAASLTGLL